MDFDDKHKQRLDHLQAVINRVEGNTFNIKTLCITIVSAAIAFAASNAQSAPLVISSALAVVMIFWCLDANYLTVGRHIRKKYDELTPFEDRLTGSANEKIEFRSVMFSWSVGWFYVAVLMLLAAILFYLYSVTPEVS